MKRPTATVETMKTVCERQCRPEGREEEGSRFRCDLAFCQNIVRKGGGLDGRSCFACVLARLLAESNPDENELK